MKSESRDGRWIVSDTRPRAKKPYWCTNCGCSIANREIHQKIVWSDKDGVLHSDRLHLRCPTEDRS